MIKPNSLRQALTAAIPALATDPDALRMWVDKGRIVARRSENLAFEYRYTLNVVLQDFTAHPDLVFLAINRWLEVHQPNLLAGLLDESYSFEADIIDSQTIDLSIELPLSEPVLVTDSGAGKYELQHLAEPAALLPDMLGLSSPAIPLTSIWWHGERLVPEGGA